jgi:hypothetical protein
MSGVVVGLFVGFERRFFRELPLAALASHKIERFPHGHGGPEIKGDSLMVASRAGNFFQAKRDIGLRLQIEIHVGVHREGVETFFADAAPIAVASHKPFVNAETRLFTDGTSHCAESLFYFLLS